MAVQVVMPKLGLNMTEGTVVQWLKREGDRVERGEPLFVLETDKTTMEAEAQASGVLGRILATAGETVPVATVVAIIVAEGEQIPETLAFAPPIRTARESVAPAAARPQEEMKPELISEARVLASPVAKRLAREQGVDLSTVPGTGLGGRITQEDVERVMAAKQARVVEPAGVEVIRVKGVRAVIAERMMQSVRNTAQVTLHMDADAGSLVAYRSRLKAEDEASGGEARSYNAVLISLVARALREHPYMNATAVGHAIQLLDEVNVGLAVDTERGLLVVVVRSADKKSIANITEELSGLSQRAQVGTSMPDDLTGGTFTVTNLGTFGVETFTPIINPPEMGILGIGRIMQKPVVRSGQVIVGQTIGLSLTFDHRWVDGAPAARFLQFIRNSVEQLE
jgi:pyruvate dehydrogenase E2 component (dihydrolipoamide acetyltransferase)